MSAPLLTVPHDPTWAIRFEDEAHRIRDALGPLCVALHHVGSTSVPGLRAKPVIDMILVVTDLSLITQSLQSLGYIGKGPLNIPFRLYFSKEDVHIHAYEPSHPEIALNLLFRDYLRTHPQDRDAYAHLKNSLSSKETATQKKGLFSAYTLGKDAFIREILHKAGFNSVCLRVCTHTYEWERYHYLRKTYLFERSGIVYDPHHPSLQNPHTTHFILYHGTHIVSAATVELLNEQEAALRTFVTDPDFQNQGFGGHLLSLLEKWTKEQGRRVLKCHAWKGASPFYGKRGYKDIDFNEASLGDAYINLGKLL